MDTILVAGLGRCGSSLVMQMLAAAGIPVVGEYPAFEDERVNQHEGIGLWKGAWRGKAVKVIDPHRCVTPWDNARVIWLDRDKQQQAKSISKFWHLMMGLPLARRKQLKRLEAMLARDRDVCMGVFHRKGFPLLTLRFEDLLADPMGQANQIAAFIGADDAAVMAAVVRPRGPECYPGLLEAELLP